MFSLAAQHGGERSRDAKEDSEKSTQPRRGWGMATEEEPQCVPPGQAARARDQRMKQNRLGKIES